MASSLIAMKTGALRGARLLASPALLALILLPQPASASPYRITGMGAAETWEVKLVGKHSDKDGEETLWSTAIDLTAPLAPGLETSLTVGRGRLEEAGQKGHWGTLDTEWAVKWEVIPIKEERPFGVTIEPALIIPTGSNGLSDEEFRAELPIVIGWDLGQVRLRTLVGYAHSLESRDDELTGGALVEYRISPRFSLGADLTTRMPTAAMRDHKDIAEIGFKYEVRDGWELQGRVAQTIRSADHVRTRDAALYLEIAL